MYVRPEHVRRSIRLPQYDYASCGAYFVTICAYKRECLFGEIVDGEMVLNDNGMIVRDEWTKSAEIRSEIELDEYIIMPNHFHAIVWINDPVGAQFIAPDIHRLKSAMVNPLDSINRMGAINRAPTLGEIVRAFKARVTYRVRKIGLIYGVWQRNYYERVIRSDEELYAIRQYIRDNPVKWENDPERK
ncbi:transposase [Candidatus Uhrbacteria bacterium]|nr:transposase [Candidatus Uhrbacteria bacterium]